MSEQLLLDLVEPCCEAGVAPCLLNVDLHYYECVALHGIDAPCSEPFRLAFPVKR